MRRSGYTLIELIIVILIIAIVSGMAMSRMDFLVPKYRIRGAAREMSAVLKQGRSKASATGRDVYVRIYLSENKYELLVPFEKPNPALAMYPPETPPEDLPPKQWDYMAVLQKSLPDKVNFVNAILGSESSQTITSGTLTIRMTPYGLGNHLIVNFSMYERRMALKLNGLTGYCGFYEEEKKADELLEDSLE